MCLLNEDKVQPWIFTSCYTASTRLEIEVYRRPCRCNQVSGATSLLVLII